MQNGIDHRLRLEQKLAELHAEMRPLQEKYQRYTGDTLQVLESLNSKNDEITKQSEIKHNQLVEARKTLIFVSGTNKPIIKLTEDALSCDVYSVEDAKQVGEAMAATT